MKNRILYRILDANEDGNIRSLLWGFVSILILLPLLSFYPWKFRIGFAALLILFSILDSFVPRIATFVLAASGVFFGNHPGGRFLELQDCLWIVWSLRGIAENRLHGNRILQNEFWKRPLGILLLLFFGTAFSSLLANPDLLSDLRFYRKGWFWFLHSTELEPIYPWKLLLLGILFVFGLLSRNQLAAGSSDRTKPDSVFLDYAAGISFGILIAVFAGWTEYFFPFAKSTLDGYHRWLDGYKLAALPHSLIPSLERYLPLSAIQSLYWNRSWFAIHLIASLPFLFYWLFSEATDRFRKLRVPFLILLVFVLAVTFFWIGARGGVLSFLAFLGMSAFVFAFFRLGNKEKIVSVFSAFLSFLFVIAGIVFPFVVIATNAGTGDVERLSHFLAGTKLFFEKPLFGGGFESFGWYNECCLNQEGRQSPYHTAHNQFLQIFSGIGVFGAAVYAALWGFLFYEFLAGKRKGRSLAETSLVFGSVFAVFVYSFFQEWFYLRAVYFQWIALFAVFSSSKEEGRESFVERNVARVKLWLSQTAYNIRGFECKKSHVSALGGLILLLGSWVLFPTTLYRSGIYFPPGNPDPYEALILEGKGQIVLVSKPAIYDVYPARGFGFVDLSFSTEGAEFVPYKQYKQDIPRDEWSLRTIEGKNILKTECTLRDVPSPLSTLFFWIEEPIDPEPRKLCARFRIQKYL
ncbi:O-antigen ligase family protein [Leptospira sanjuanensis]|uniref:O-antigen ligase family protein n=1 Tax=Leptospira sanjuanensis TaxID=2879643 RepID=UPI001EE7CB23|nr:O-antigen ligase family protein [Leptospira sanjuanensis]MCG6168481.1 O-antigen ligase family protein [Leptospira sanjuanensis]